MVALQRDKTLLVEHVTEAQKTMVTRTVALSISCFDHDARIHYSWSAAMRWRDCNETMPHSVGA